MAVEQIRNKVLEAARAEQEAIRRQAEEKVHALTTQARQDADQETETFLARTRDELAEMKERAVAEVKRKNRIAILKEKNQLIDDLFRGLEELVVNMGADDFSKLMEQWLVTTHEDVPATIHFSPRDDKNVPESLLERVNRSRSSGTKLSRGASESSISAGFVFRTKNYEIANSVAQRIAELREQETIRLSKELFVEVSDAQGTS